MRLFRLALARCRALVRRDVVAGEIRDEMQFHLLMRAADYERQGLPPDDARRAAGKRFGNLAVMQDRGYDVRGGGIMETVLQDLRYGMRLFARRPGFTTVAVLTLAVGIGASTALLSVIDAALLRPLPYPHPEQLFEATIRESRAGRPARYDPSIGDARAWRGAGPIIADAGAGRLTGFTPQLVETGQAERLTVGEASEDFLEVYGVTPVAGRPFDVADTRPGAPAVALLGHAFWMSQFGGNPDALGQVIRIAGAPVTIVGVLPAGFFAETAVWQPPQIAPERVNRRGTGTPVHVRLRAGITVGEAEQALTALSRQLPPAAGHSPDVSVELESMYASATDGFRRTISTLSWAVALILAIACVNVAGLLLARGANREPELAVRASLGAGRWRLVRQLLTESLVLAGAGGVLGILLAGLFLDSLVALVPLSLPPNSPVRLNATVLVFAAALSIVTAVAFGLLPALKLSRAWIGPTLSAAGRRHGSPLSRRGGQVLVVAEVALAVVLLAGAGLMVRSFSRLLSVDVGFDPATFLTMEVDPLDGTGSTRQMYYPALLERLRLLPSVAAAGAVDYLPLRHGATVTGLKGTTGSMDIQVQQVLPGYFEAIGLPLATGRFLSDPDRTGPPVVIINREAAKRFFGDLPPLGRTVEIYGDVPRQVVGVVGNVRHYGPLGPLGSEIYIPYGQRLDSRRALTIVVRPRASMTLTGDELRQAADVVGPRVWVGPIRTAAADLQRRVLTPHRRTFLLGLLGGLGLLLTLVGISSTTAYAVARRTREVGIRMALGAQPRSVVGSMVRETAVAAAVGLVLGSAGALYATRIIASFLFETTPHDPATFAAVAALTGLSALVAAWLPARRAARVDPVVALRAE